MIDPTKADQVEIAKDKKLNLGKSVQGQEREEYENLLKEYEGVFAWTHKDLKGISPEIAEHRIDLLEGSIPVRQRQYRLNPKYSLMVKDELDKLLEVGFIYPVLSSQWVSPIVVVPKKSGPGGKVKIRVCQDFRKLNQATKKDHFPLPFTDVILDKVAGHELYSFLDGFSGYNQISIKPEDRDKTTFTTDWGTYAFTRMPFGLCNAPGTFQRAMMIIFQDFLRKFLEIFMDDFCVFSSREEHKKCLESTFKKCKEANLSLHPEKCYMAMEEGILLGHRIGKEGIKVDPDKVKVIKALLPPKNVSQLRGFLGHVGYYRRFIHRYAYIATPLTQLLKKGTTYEWTEKRQAAFEELKRRLTEAPVLMAPRWGEVWYVSIDTSGFCIGVVLAQHDDDSKEHPVYFASRQLNDAENKYTTTEREALGMVFTCKKFRYYLLGYKSVFQTDHNPLKHLANKADISGKLARWMLLLQEFDIEVKVKPGKAHQNADYLSRIKDEPGFELVGDTFPDEDLFIINVESPYRKIIHYLSTGECPKDMTKQQLSVFVHKAGPYTLINNVLHKLGPDEKLRRCLEPDEVLTVVSTLHEGIAGGHFGVDATVWKIRDAGYWWPTMYRDCRTFVQACDPCQRKGKPRAAARWPLTPILPLAPFEKWGIDFVGPIQPLTRSTKCRYILVCTDYCTKWVETQALKTNDAKVTAKFLFENIICRFGCPLELISDRGTHFLNYTVETLTEQYLIKHRKSTPYHPRTNGLVEKTNDILCGILIKMVAEHKTDWDVKLRSAVWAYHTAQKTTTGRTPFYMVHGCESVLPVEFEVPTFRTLDPRRLPEEESQDIRIANFDELEEGRLMALVKNIEAQEIRKEAYDDKLKTLTIKKGYLVLLFDGRHLKFSSKFANSWLGPFRVHEVFRNGSIQLAALDGTLFQNRVNADRLKVYHQFVGSASS